jgi:nucleoid-associated protein YgaU
MPTGTKVILAIVGLLVGLLVVYYGFMLPGPDPVAAETGEDKPLVILDPASAAAGASAASDNALLVQPESLVPMRDESSTVPQGLLSSGLRNAIRDPMVTDQPGVLGRDQAPAPNLSPPVSSPPASSLSNAAGSGASPALATPPPVTTTPTPAIPTEYSIRSGDTLSSIAQQWFGDADKWDLIAEANPSIDPHRLRIGQRITLPTLDARRAETPRAGRESLIHTVKAGETLSGLAKSYYGNGGLWERIYVANKLTLNHDPNALQVGMRIIIPPTPY